jgi:hypothetical protein
MSALADTSGSAKRKVSYFYDGTSLRSFVRELCMFVHRCKNLLPSFALQHTQVLALLIMLLPQVRLGTTTMGKGTQ